MRVIGLDRDFLVRLEAVRSELRRLRRVALIDGDAAWQPRNRVLLAALSRLLLRSALHHLHERAA